MDVKHNKDREDSVLPVPRTLRYVICILTDYPNPGYIMTDYPNPCIIYIAIDYLSPCVV
jgi:hypothetical protein